MSDTRKTTFLFEMGTSGWSETWYRTATDSDATFAAARQLAQNRAGLLPAGAAIVGFRITDPFTQISPVVSTARYTSPNARLREVSQLSLLCSARLDPSGAKRFYLRGMPDDVVRDNEFTPDDDYTKKFEDWKRRIVSGRWCAKVRNKSFATFPNCRILGDGTYNTFAANGFVEGQLVRVLRARDSLGVSISGVYQVKNVTTPIIGILFGYPSTGTVFSCQMRSEVQSFYPVSRVFEERVGVRKTGRPFSLTAGRRPRKKRLLLP